MKKEAFLQEVRSYNPNANEKLISMAYDFAKEAHKGQKRLSGEPYFRHLVEVAHLLVTMRLDSQTICASLLHDIFEDTKTKKETIKKMFGDEITMLIEGVTKMRKIRISSEQRSRAENVRKVLFATVKDTRVILIKLADRLHNMRTLKYQDLKSQKEISKETMNIYVPIAYKLGMYRIKSELEDLCLRFLKPDVYQDLKNRIAKKKRTRERDVRTVIKKVKKELGEKGIDARVNGRAKNFYSIYKKMKNKGIPLEKIHDLSAVRIISNSADDCYRILGLVHSKWTPIHEGFDDYIASPKPNMYQSLHTEVLIDKKPVEIQIRTRDMHHLAEDGIAAHWKYKGTDEDKRFDKKVSWLKQILEWKTSRDARDFVEKVKIDLFKDEIFAITPRGDLISLPEKATTIDFAYAVHTDIGNHCIRAKVNDKLVPMDTELKSGDIVEIVTAKNAKPSRNWLKFVKSTLAKSKIRQVLGISYEGDEKMKKFEAVLADKVEAPGIRRVSMKISRCCHPRYGDNITGFLMKDKRINVHKSDCQKLKTLDKKRRVKTVWKKLEDIPMTTIHIEVMDRIGLFSEILGVMSGEEINVETINTKTTKSGQYLILEVIKAENIENAVRKIKQIKNVLDVKYE
ncbi:MAG: bifunctional (p)ppGpp synthetase/guanosine-3',5'-bis(diphosphate) 3'-pyrophosphohydrolase [bacterium]|nr:bifunctional (p)ppGpp synthetase/guanosine-3',5'-bis(diphosphate) 3'-pyrophosphohydrolase [bacterium]